MKLRKNSIVPLSVSFKYIHAAFTVKFENHFEVRA